MGIEPWLAEHDRQPGTALGEKVRLAIRRSTAVLVLLTRSAYESAYVQQEIGAALEAKVLVIPLVDPALKETMELGMLQGVEWATFDFADPTPECLANLYVTLHYIGTRAAAATTKSTSALTGPGLTASVSFQAQLKLEPADLLVAGGVAFLIVALLVLAAKNGNAPGT